MHFTGKTREDRYTIQVRPEKIDLYTIQVRPERIDTLYR